jgi:hypothetical protein
MQIASTFRGWGCELVWTIDEGKDYPRLWWENKPGQSIEPKDLSGLLAGSGTEADPFLIYTSEELKTIGLFPCDLDKHFKLMADIDLNCFRGTDFNIIGKFLYVGENRPFTGIFDGNGHTISNFIYSSKDINYIGCFGYVRGENAQIRNLGLVEPIVDIEGGLYVGSLVGKLWGGKLINCYTEGGRVTGNALDVGGLVGSNVGTIASCYSAASVGGNGLVGGLVGYNQGTIANCYATGSTSADYNVGGLVGYNCGGITNCYSIGSVLGDENVGGLVGSGYANDVIASFWDIKISGQSTGVGGTGKTTAEMQTACTFLEVGWDFVGETANGTEDIWWIDEGKDYPRLWWEAAEP